MCLVTLKTAKIKNAQEDVIVYKAFEIYANSLYSPYNRMNYEFDKLYHTEIKPDRDGGSFCMMDFNESQKYKLEELKYIGQGFHSVKDLHIFKNELFMDSYIIYKAIIPKGAKYIEGFCGTIVSSKIIIINEIIEL